MHFLSHYYVELPENQPLYVVGLAIPDLTESFSRVYNSVISKSAEPDNHDLKHVHKGILAHYKGDKWFHNSPLFLEHLSLLSRLFTQGGLSRERLRLSVIAHVAVEMMIDRQIVLQQPAICEAYYKLVDRADESLLKAYFDGLKLEKEKQNFISRFQFFKQRRFILLFKDLDRIVFGLNRIYSSVTGVEFTEEEKQLFITALSNIDTGMRYSWKEILKA